MEANCESCMNYYYDEEWDTYLCTINMDEDEVAKMSFSKYYKCPYFRMGDDYTIVKKQN